MRRMGGGEWYESMANGLGLRRLAFFFFWNQLSSFNLHISVSACNSKVNR